MGSKPLVLPRIGGVAVEVRPPREQDALPDDMVVVRLPEHRTRDGDARAEQGAQQLRPAHLRLCHGGLPHPRLAARLRHHDTLSLEKAVVMAEGTREHTIILLGFSVKPSTRFSTLDFFFFRFRQCSYNSRYTLRIDVQRCFQFPASGRFVSIRHTKWGNMTILRSQGRHYIHGLITDAIRYHLDLALCYLK